MKTELNFLSQRKKISTKGRNQGMALGQAGFQDWAL
jgi:hypothetical protein